MSPKDRLCIKVGVFQRGRFQTRVKVRGVDRKQFGGSRLTGSVLKSSFFYLQFLFGNFFWGFEPVIPPTKCTLVEISAKGR